MYHSMLYQLYIIASIYYISFHHSCFTWYICIFDMLESFIIRCMYVIYCYSHVLSYSVAYHIRNINTAIHNTILDITAIHNTILDITAIHNAILNINR